jgi:ribosome-associated translation inhibitor RaiA
VKEFIVIKKQSNGCDYTIGCGISISYVSAESEEAAIDKIFGFNENELREAIEEHILDYGEKWEYYLSDYINDYVPRNYGDNKLESVELIEIVPGGSCSEVIDQFDSVEEKLESMLQKHRDQFTEILERGELKRLKEKYDKS